MKQLITLSAGFALALCAPSPVLAQSQIVSILRPQGGRLVGPMATIRDVDTDGCPEIVTLVEGAPDILPEISRVEVRGARTGVVLWSVGDSNPLSGFGGAAAGGSDFDADGVDDLIIGAPGVKPFFSPSMAGTVTTRSGKTGALLSTFTTADVDGLFGWSVAGLGDVDSDGFGELAIAAPTEDHGGVAFAGVVRVFSGQTGLEKWSLSGASSESWCGRSIASIGDWDGDGVGDVLIAAPSEDAAGLTNSGAVQIASGATGHVHYYRGGAAGFDGLGFVVSAANDLNADGFCDVIAYSTLHTAGGTSTAVLAIAGGSGTSLFEIHAPISAYASLCAAGDLNEDGISDIAVGDGLGFGPGGQYGWIQTYAGPSGALLWTAYGTSSSKGLGERIANVGDVNGDGIADIGSSSKPIGSNVEDAVRIFTATCGKTETLGTSCPSSHGALPGLTVIGSPCLTPLGSGVTLRVDLTVNPTAPFWGLVLLSPSETSIPFGGGCTLIVGPTPTVPIIVPMFTGLYGLALDPVPLGLPLGPYVAQAFRADSGLPSGYYATNGVRLTVE